MKKIITLSVILLLLGLSVYFLYRKVHQTEYNKESYQRIPTFRLSDLNNHCITESALQKNSPTLFLFFNPDCDLCRNEIKHIQLHQEAFSSCQMVFFTPASTDKIVGFLDEISFTPSVNMLFLADEDEQLTRKMEVRTSPTSYIYNRKGQLIKRFNGSVKTETLMIYLLNHED